MSKPIKSTEELLREHDSESLMQGDLQKALGVKPPAKDQPAATTIEVFKAFFVEGMEYPVPIGWIDFDDKSGTFMRQSEEVLFALPKTQEIENSLLAHGQTNPVKVRFNQAGKLQIIDGWTRSLLLRKNNKVSVTVKVLNISEQEAALMAGEDNFDRQEIPDYFKAEYTNRLATVQGVTAEKIAERFGVNKQYVYKVLAIFKFPPVLESLKKNEISLNAARRLAEVGNKLSAKDLQTLVNKTAKKEVQIQNIVREVEEGPAGGKKGSSEKKDSEEKPKQEKTLQKLPNGKHVFNKVVFDPENATLREVDSLLKDVGSFRDILWSSKKDLEKKKRK